LRDECRFIISILIFSLSVCFELTSTSHLMVFYL
jgi:hypothetical protein